MGLLQKMIGGTVYIQIYKNRFELVHAEQNKKMSYMAAEPFTTSRLLVGEIRIAEAALGEALDQLLGEGLFQAAPDLVIHPMEFCEEGLSEVEERVFIELGASSGGRNVFLWTGHTLTEPEILQGLYKPQLND